MSIDMAFSHSDDCPILRAHPDVVIPWSELEPTHWVATCRCTTDHYYSPRTRPARLDPLDPRTGRHLGQCEFIAERDPAVLKVLLKVTERDGYWWVECGACEAGWQVPHYALESVR